MIDFRSERSRLRRCAAAGLPLLVATLHLSACQREPQPTPTETETVNATGKPEATPQSPAGNPLTPVGRG
ncbi:MAG: hypothetical protein KGP14_16855, partial [Betaproteobacteria bacterium]|nr:hypothetical protein [Betaproteobacteria bacterium]